MKWVVHLVWWLLDPEIRRTDHESRVYGRASKALRAVTEMERRNRIREALDKEPRNR